MIGLVPGAFPEHRVRPGRWLAPSLRVPETLRTLCDVLILVDQAAQPVVSSDVVNRSGGAAREGP